MIQLVISYEKLWKILDDRKITRKELARRSGISDTTMKHMWRGENVSLTMLAKICDTLHVNLGDIAEFVEV